MSARSPLGFSPRFYFPRGSPSCCAPCCPDLSAQAGCLPPWVLSRFSYNELKVLAGNPDVPAVCGSASTDHFSLDCDSHFPVSFHVLQFFNFPQMSRVEKQ